MARGTRHQRPGRQQIEHEDQHHSGGRSNHDGGDGHEGHGRPKAGKAAHRPGKGGGGKQGDEAGGFRHGQT
jgi:hypothetical protein